MALGVISDEAIIPIDIEDALTIDKSPSIEGKMNNEASTNGMVLDIVSDEGIFPIDIEDVQTIEKSHSPEDGEISSDTTISSSRMSDMPDLVKIQEKRNYSGSELDETKSSHSSSANASELLDDLMSTMTNITDIGEVLLLLYFLQLGLLYLS